MLVTSQNRAGSVEFVNMHMEQLCKLVQHSLGVLVGLEDKSIFTGPL
jgi:hypothetical protein